MADKTVRVPASSTHSAADGKFYFRAVASFTASKISVSLQIVVTDVFKSNQKVTAVCNGETKSKKVKKKGTHTIGTVQITTQSVPAISFSCAKKKSKIDAGTIRNLSNAPAAPSSIKAEKINDARIDLVVSGSGFATVPTNSIEVERCRDVYDTNAFTPIPSSPFTPASTTGSYTISASDESSDIERGHRYWFRARAFNSTSEKYSEWVYSGNANHALYTSSDNESLSGSITAQRICNGQVNLSWEISSVAFVNNRLVTSFQVFRITDGGAAIQIAIVDASTENVAYSYEDRETSADHVYQYQLKAKGEGDTAETFSETSELVYMSPTRPQGVTAAHTSSGDVDVTITNQSNTATQVLIERRKDGGAWTLISEEEYVPGGLVYTDEDVEVEESLEYRVRNKCDQLMGTDMYSDYITSAPVIEKSAPNPPTLKSPVSGSSFALDEGSVRLSWQHNATDGSAQEEAELRYKKNDGEWITETFTDEAFFLLDISSGYSANDEISWKVRTRGAYTGGVGEGYSDWSDESSFTILTKPQITFTSPESAGVITSLPVDLSFSYSDLSGTLKRLVVAVRREGELQAEFDIPVGDGTGGTYQYSLADFLFENDTVYSLTATALSSSGFSSVSDISITIAYEAVSLDGGLIPVVTFDEDGIATIVVERDLTPDDEGVVPEPAEIQDAYLYRVHDRSRTLVEDQLNEGMQIEDRYAPINMPFSYELLMLTEDGQVSIVAVEVEQSSPYWFVYWGEHVARAQWNPEGSVQLKRPEKTQVRYSGRKYPVSYDSDAIEETFSFSAVLFDRDELDNFKQMIRDGGRGIWKSGDGDVYDADFEFTYSSDYKGYERRWNASLAVTRIDGDT